MTGAGLARGERSEGLARRDWALAAGLALATGLLYAFTFQKRTYGDGSGLVSMHVLQAEEHYHHALFLPLCDVLQAVLGLRDPFLVLHLVSVLGGSLGLGAAYLVLRLCGAACFGALVAAGLLALSPVLWFFATTVHTQPLQFGIVACSALLTLLAPWRRPGLALALVAAFFPVLVLAHISAFTLGPGWVFLVQFARGRQGSRFTWRMLFLGVGPLLLAALVLGLALSMLMRLGSLAHFGDTVQKQFALEEALDEVVSPSFRTLWAGWVVPLGLLLPLALAGCARLRRMPGLASAIALLVGVPTGFFLWWGTFEKGGYFLASASFLAVPVALLLDRLSAPWLALALVALGFQGSLARRQIDAWDTGWDPAERTAQVREAIGDSGLLLSTTDMAPDIRCYLPGVQEWSLLSFVRNTRTKAGHFVPPEEILAELEPRLDRLLERSPRVCVELAYGGLDSEDSLFLPVQAPALHAIEAYLRERYEVRDLPHPHWPIMVLERRR